MPVTTVGRMWRSSTTAEGFMTMKSMRYGCWARSQLLTSALIVSLGAFMLGVADARPLHGLKIASAILVLSLFAHGCLVLWDQYHRQGTPALSSSRRLTVSRRLSRGR
jgi:hypothetical protein